MSLAGRKIIAQIEDEEKKSEENATSSHMRSAATGAFICTAGVAVMIVAIFEACEQWFPHVATLYPFLAAGCLIVAAASVFWGSNYSELEDGTISDFVFRKTIGQRKWLPATVGAAGLAVAGLALALTLLQAHKCSANDSHCPEREYFAVMVPPQTQPGPQTDKQGKATIFSVTNAAGQQMDLSIAQNISQQSNAGTSQRTAPAAPTTVLTWSIDRERTPLPHGIPAIFLGGLFTAAFGIWFARMGDGADKSIAIGEKLLAPVLSLGLIGFGASQHAEATKEEKDIRLAERGLPPILNVPDGQKGLAVRLYQPEELNAETHKFLNDRIQGAENSLMSQIAGLSQTDGEQKARLEETHTVIEDLKNQLSHLPKTGDWATKQDIEIVRQNLTSLAKITDDGKKRLGELQDKAKTDRQWQCTFWTENLSKVAEQKNQLQGAIDGRDEEIKNYKNENPWRWHHLVNSEPQPLKREMSEVKALEGLSGRITEAQKTFCDTKAPLSDNNGNISR
jgi:hypothetical protein